MLSLVFAGLVLLSPHDSIHQTLVTAYPGLEITFPGRLLMAFELERHPILAPAFDIEFSFECSAASFFFLNARHTDAFLQTAHLIITPDCFPRFTSPWDVN